MIDEKPIKTEISIVKRIFDKLGSVSGFIGDFFSFLKQEKLVSKLQELPSLNFLDECADIIEDASYKTDKGLIVTFHSRTRELADKLADRGIDVGKQIYFLDCVSRHLGNGTPPVLNLICLNEPDDTENIFYYTLMQLKKLGAVSPFVAVISPENILGYANMNDAGIFFDTYTKHMEKESIPLLFLCKDSADKLFKELLQRIIDGRKDYEKDE